MGSFAGGERLNDSELTNVISATQSSHQKRTELGDLGPPAIARDQKQRTVATTGRMMNAIQILTTVGPRSSVSRNFDMLESLRI